VAAQQLDRRWVGIDISPTSSRVMGERLEKVCGMKPLPVTMGIEDFRQLVGQHPGGAGIPARDSLDSSKDNGGQDARPTQAKNYYRYSNLPRTREQLRALPGFEFENWAVLELLLLQG